MNKRLIVTSAISLTIIFFVIGISVGFVISDDISHFLTEKKLIAPSSSAAYIDNAREIIKESYVESVDDKTLEKGSLEGSIEGMVAALNDPYADYFTMKDLEHFRMESEGFFFGVGLHVETVEDRVKVVKVIPDSPAEKADMKKDDIIVSVDNKSVAHSSLDAVVGKIRGPRGTTVEIGVERADVEEVITFKLVRDKINFENTTSKMLPGNIGYIQMHQFNSEGTAKLSKDLDDLHDKGAKGTILDLRGNPGGFLNDAVEVAGFFLPSGKIVVVEKPRTGPKREHRTPSQGDIDTPLVILVDNKSASASEIVAAALQEYDRATIVGEKTFGKASVQEVIPMPNQTAIKLTVAKYLTPKGKSINKVGVKPDVVIKFDPKAVGTEDNQLDKAVQVLNKLITGEVQDAA